MKFARETIDDAFGIDEGWILICALWPITGPLACVGGIAAVICMLVFAIVVGISLMIRSLTGGWL